MSKIIEGNLPLTIENQNTEKIRNYQIYGTANGAGVETENKLIETHLGWYFGGTSGATITEGSSSYGMLIATVVAGKTYRHPTPMGNYNQRPKVAFFETKPEVGSEPYDGKAEYTTHDYGPGPGVVAGNAVFVAPITGYVVVQQTKQFIELLQSVLMVVESEDFYDMRTYVDGYTPPGYKLPMTVESGEETENLFDANSVIMNSYYNQNGVLTPATSENLAASPLIPVEKGETYIRSSQGTAVGNMYVVFDANKNFLYRGSPSTTGLPITIEGNGAYIGFTVDYRVTPLPSYMFTKGSTPPDHYIPYRYSTTTPIYIGDSKLGAEEYVDYESGKVYKRSKNYLKLKTHKDGDEIIHGITWTTNSKDGTVTANGTADSNSESICGTILYCPEDVPPGNYYFSGCPAGGAQSSVYNMYDWDSNHSKRNPDWNGVVRGVNCYNNSEVPIKINSGLKIVIACRVYRGITVNDLVFRPMLRAADSEAGFEPYLNPTDPPVALPELSLYKGTNTLSSTAEVGKVIIDYSVPEVFKVQLENQLYNLIDKNFYNIIANSYSSSLTYNEGDYCIYNYQLYKCISAISIPEDFDSEKWSQVTLAESLRGD